MTAGKDDLDKATQLGTRTKQGNWTGDYHQFALGFSDGVRAAGKNDVVDTREPHERYGHWLKQQPLKNGALTGWDGHYTCMKHAHKCTSELFPDALYEDNWTGEQALQLLRGRPADQPFFLQVSFPGPHPPFLVTPKQLSAVAGRTFPGPIDNTDRAAETCAASAQPKSSSSDRCDYAAEIENLDRLIGALVAEVERTDQGLNNTLVCFASDHGEMLGDHGDHGKTMPWQGSASVPLICAGAGVTAGGVVSFPVATLDLAATFVDYAQATPPAGSTARSLRPLLEARRPPTVTDAPRPYVNSGLQSMPFGEELDAQNGYSWRMVVEVATGLKLVCCRGPCPGAPKATPPVDPATGFQQTLLNTTGDPFDMHPIDDAAASARLRAKLPAGFRCGEKGALTAAELESALSAEVLRYFE